MELPLAAYAQDGRTYHIGVLNTNPRGSPSVTALFDELRRNGLVEGRTLHPPDRRTDADIKLFGRLTSGSSFFHEVDDARSQLTRIRSMHWAALRRINALDSHLRRVLGIPIHCGRDVL